VSKIVYLPVEWRRNRVRILDQTRLPLEESYLETGDYREVAQAIRELKVRGAPAIGVAAAYGVAVGGLSIKSQDRGTFLAELGRIIEVIASTRPTAKNLFGALSQMEAVARDGSDVTQIKKTLVTQATKIHSEETAATKSLSRLGAELMKDGFTILTHCNTGPLATTGYGTALGVVIQAFNDSKEINVFATETRPLCQGARLTTWELKQAGVPVTLITDSMAGYFMGQGKINCVILGADRIAANGDTANKIGTYSLAVLARAHDIPFYVAAPSTTFDLEIESGAEIPIEQRRPEEVTHIRGVRIAPEGIGVANPAFDVTPHHLIAAIITEQGIIREPYGEGIKRIS
jgi:methylthioribose-1-phosphate isomerase